MSTTNEEKWREDCRQAILEFDESGKLATSEVSDALRHAYFRAGYLAARKKAQEAWDKLDKHCVHLIQEHQYCSITSQKLENATKKIQKRDKLIEQAKPWVNSLSIISGPNAKCKPAVYQWLKEVEDLNK